MPAVHNHFIYAIILPDNLAGGERKAWSAYLIPQEDIWAKQLR